jgi:hypothetical protein
MEGKLFDPTLELFHLDERALRYGLQEKTLFYAARAVAIMEGLGITPWTISVRSGNGCLLTGLGHQHLLEVRLAHLRGMTFILATARRGLDAAEPQRVSRIIVKGRETLLAWSAIVRHVSDAEGVPLLLPAWEHESARLWYQWQRAMFRRILPPITER